MQIVHFALYKKKRVLQRVFYILSLSEPSQKRFFLFSYFSFSFIQRWCHVPRSTDHFIFFLLCLPEASRLGLPFVLIWFPQISFVPPAPPTDRWNHKEAAAAFILFLPSLCPCRLPRRKNVSPMIGFRIATFGACLSLFGLLLSIPYFFIHLKIYFVYMSKVK